LTKKSNLLGLAELNRVQPNIREGHVGLNFIALNFK
jgi:hypothetical protein